MLWSIWPTVQAPYAEALQVSTATNNLYFWAAECVNNITLFHIVVEWFFLVNYRYRKQFQWCVADNLERAMFDVSQIQ